MEVCPDTGSVTARYKGYNYVTLQFSDWNSFNHGSCSVSGEKCMSG